MKNMKARYTKSILFGMLSIAFLLFLQFPAFAEHKGIPSKLGPQRIVVFPLFAEEILYELVEPERIVYVGHRYDEAGIDYWPTMSISRNAAGANWQNSGDEDLLALHPDLLIFSGFQEDEYEEIFPCLAAAETPTLFLDEPSSIDEIADSIMLLGNTVHEPERASSMVDKLRSSMDCVSKLVAELPENEIKTVALYGEPSHFFNIATTSCRIRGIYCPDEKALTDINPDIIVLLPSCSDAGFLLAIGKDYVNEIIDALISDTSLSSLAAITSNSIYVVNFYGSQYVSDSVMMLLKLAYPELLNDDALCFIKSYPIVK